MYDESKQISYLGLLIDDYSKEFFIDGEPKRLQRMQYLLLLYFMQNVGKVISHEELQDNVWKKFVTDRNIIVCISKLRSILGPYAKHLVTIHKFGYRLNRYD